MVVPVKDIFYTKDIFYKGHFPEFKVLAIHAHPWVAPLFKCHNLPQWQTLLKSTSKKHWNQESQTVARNPYLHLAKVTKLPVFPRKRFHLNNRYVFSKRMWQLSIELYALSFFFLFFTFQLSTSPPLCYIPIKQNRRDLTRISWQNQPLFILWISSLLYARVS